MSASLDALVAELAPAARELVDAAGAAGLMPRVTSTLRSRAEQTRLFRRSQQGLQHYPVAPPGSSAHEYGWAFDLIVSPFDAIYDVGYTWQQWGGAWSPSDAVHFEIPGASAEAKRLGGGFDLPTEVGTAMGKGADIFIKPIAGSIPYVEDVLKVSAEMEPYARASLAAQIYLWLNR